MKIPGFLKLLLAALLSMPFYEGNAQVSAKKHKQEKTPAKTTGRTLYGQASFYSNKFDGRRTATGETFSQAKFTAACNSLPLGTWIQVTNMRNGKMVVVKTNDHLHPKTKRLIDLSRAGAKKLGYVASGLTRVKVIVLDQSLYK